MHFFELSSKKYKNGRRPFKAALYELQPPDSVVDDVGTKFNKNGLTFLEEYAKNALDSIEEMSIRVEFTDEDRTTVYAHGDTGEKDGMPVFENATTIGHFKHGYIDDVDINGVKTRCVIGEGVIDEMCYPEFVKVLEEQIENGNPPEGSIEIYRTSDNEGIVYKKGWLPEGRIPTEYIHSGWDIVMNPADSSSILLELNSNQKKEDLIQMDEKELKELIKQTITETNSRNTEYENQITQLNSQIAEKDATIAEQNATIEQVQTALNQLKEEQETAWDERRVLEDELAKLKAEKRINELNEAISDFTDEEKKFAESEINSFKEDPANGDINSIVNKIYAKIGEKSKQQTTSEQNSQQGSGIDIYGDMEYVPAASATKDLDSIF